MASIESGQATENGVARIPRPSAVLPVPGPKISNIVCGVNLNCRFELKKVAMSARNAIYNPKRFPAAVLRIREPKATALVFEGGKMQVLGTKSIDDAKLAARRFARQLRKIGFNPRLEDFVVQNIVASADTKMLIRLEGLQAGNPWFTKYEPELFPGLVYTVMKPKMKVLVFAKGKLVFLGAKRTADLDTAMNLMYTLLTQYRMH